MRFDNTLWRRWDSALIAGLDAVIRRRFPGFARYIAENEPGVTRPSSVAFPRTINDKFAWRKLFDHDPRFVTACDKLASKPFVATRAPALRVAPLLWDGRDAADIPDALWQGPAMLKASHGCRMNLALPVPDRTAAIAKANGWLGQNYGAPHGEWGYYQVPRRLFVEGWVGPPGQAPDELKIYAFGGRLHRIVHIRDRFGAMAAAAWIPDPASSTGWRGDAQGTAVADADLDAPLPPTLDAALDAARALAEGFDHMRVDLHLAGDEVWFGELTAYNLSGHMPFWGHLADHPANRDWDIRQSWFLTTKQRGWRGLYAAALRRELTRQARRQATPR
ncbi:MAG: ATP-grasp fold amidoligase family protein [Pseudomonadota bacterium]